MIPKIIHFTVPATQSAEQIAIIAKAKALHPDWEVMVWQDPVGAANFQLNSLWKYANSGAQLADLIRLDVVYLHGGIYLDSDVNLHRRLDDLLGFDFFVASEDGHELTNAVFGATRNSPILKGLIDHLLNDTALDWSLSPNLTTGPRLFSRLLHWDSDVAVIPRQTFYPYNWNETASRPHKFSYGSHLWRKSWGREFQSSTSAHQSQPLVSRIKTAPLKVVRNILVNILLLTRRAYALRWSNERYIRHFAARSLSYQASGNVCVNTIHGFRILASGADLSISPELISRGYYELREELFVRKIMRGGDWGIDVGANVGIFSLLMAWQVGPFGRIYSYEPNPTCSELLQKSAVMNWMHDRIVVRAVGVGSVSGELTLSVAPDRLGDSTILPPSQQGVFSKVTAAANVRSLQIEVVRLDDEFPINLPIRILKIDAEGFEHHVLNGAARLLRDNAIDYVLLEVLPDVASQVWCELRDAINVLKKSGYLPHSVGRNGRLKQIRFEDVFNAHNLSGRNIVFKSPSETTLPSES